MSNSTLDALVDRLAAEMPSRATAKRFRANVQQSRSYDTAEKIVAYAEREKRIGRRGKPQ